LNGKLIVKVIDTNFDTPDANFDLLNLFRVSDVEAKMLEIRGKNVTSLKEPIKTKQRSMKLSQIRRWIELYMREIILRFEMNL
jgi:hypothetical protein